MHGIVEDLRCRVDHIASVLFWNFTQHRFMVCQGQISVFVGVFYISV